MNNKIIGVIMGLLVVSLSAIIVLANPKTLTPASQTPPAAVVPVAPSGYTMSQVAEHKTVSNCWSAVNGNVYDLTAWISNHPGGEGAILRICGKDGSGDFNEQHSGARRPANELAGFKIGPLIK